MERSVHWVSRVILVPEFLQTLESRAQVIPIVGLRVLLVEFFQDRFKIVQAADRATTRVIPPGGVFANAAEQDGLRGN